MDATPPEPGPSPGVVAFRRLCAIALMIVGLVGMTASGSYALLILFAISFDPAFSVLLLIFLAIFFAPALYVFHVGRTLMAIRGADGA